MVSKLSYAYCCEDISLIENYEEAINSKERYNCHHRLETHDENGLLRDVPITSSKLIEMNLYYNRPAKELIFLTLSEHQKIHHSSKVYRGMMSKRMSERIVSKETRDKQASYLWYTNGVIEIRAKNCPEGFRRGKLPFPKSHSENMSKGKKGSKWYNDGKKNILTKDCPEGFVPGRLQLGYYLTHKGTQWYNNGKVSIQSFECPEGFVPGFLINKDKVSKNMKGMKFFNNGKIQIRAKECPEGFVPGRLYENNTGKSVYNNGKINVMAFECPEGFVPGKLPFSEESKKNFGKSLGKKWFNNGVYSTTAFECPPGFKPGRLRKK